MSEEQEDNDLDFNSHDGYMSAYKALVKSGKLSTEDMQEEV